MGKVAASKRVMRSIPDLHSIKPSHVLLTSNPNGVTAPKPVTTTLSFKFYSPHSKEQLQIILSLKSPLKGDLRVYDINKNIFSCQ